MPFFDQNLAELCRIGLAHLEASRFDEALPHFTEAVAAQPDFAPGLHALALIARGQRRSEEALDYGLRALAAAPEAAQRHVLVARILCDLERPADAVGHYRMAVARDAADAESRLELANVAERLGASAEAIVQYRAALVLRPADHAARRRLTFALRKAGRRVEAAEACRQRIELVPDDPEPYFDLGNTLHDAERYEAAAEAFRAALRLQPDHVGALENLGSTLMELGDLVSAEEYLRQARAWHPELPGPHNGLGSVLSQRGLTEAAEAAFRAALERAPDHAEASCNLATTLLLTGRMTEGWRRLEARWGTAELRPRGFAAPLWQGEALAGRTLLLHAEQGFGDTLQFCRFIDRIKGGRLILEVPAPLQRLMRLSFPGLADVVVRGDIPPEFDLHCPLMSLPLMLRVRGTAFTDRPTYLTVDPLERAAWRTRLAALPGRRVGLVWRGNPRLAGMRRRRDLPVQHLARLADLPGISFVSLQKDLSEAERTERDALLPMQDWTGALDDLAATAALVSGLDLVIGVDTAIVHLAGALGRPVVLLNRFDTCWRWMAARADSPWYPSLHQIRQDTSGNWDGVVATLVGRLLSSDGNKEKSAL